MSSSATRAYSVADVCLRSALLRRSASYLLAGLCTLVSVGRAQAPKVADYRVRVSDLSRIWEVAKAAEDSATRAAGQLETIQLGSLTVVAASSQRAVVTVAAGRAWDRLDSAIGRDTELINGKVFYTQLAATAATITDSGVDLVFMDAAGIEQLSWNLLKRVMRALLQDLDEGTRTWFGGVLPFKGVLEPSARSAYVELVLARSPHANRCLQGDLANCRVVLGLLDPEPSAELEPTGAAAVRHHFARVALELGGEGAYARLWRSAGVSLEQRLTAAAGVSRDSLIEFWLQDLLLARPAPALVTGRILLSGLAWVLGLLLVSSRSSRWRLG